MFDAHMHTTPFSPDSSMTLDEVLLRQQELSIGVILTEHLDLGFPGPMKFEYEPSEYFKRYLPYRNDRLLLGTEVGMQTQFLKENLEFIHSAPFDMIMASVHMISGYDIYYPEYFEAMNSKTEAYRTYLNAIAENIELLDDFDTMGHIDYICRNAPYEDNELYYTDFPDEIDTILRTLIHKNKALELNTRRFGNPVSVETLLPIYKRYHELGGRYITIGSDAHTQSAVGAYFAKAAAFAETCQLTPVYFKERHMQFDK